jgi:hypothetical protein
MSNGWSVARCATGDWDGIVMSGPIDLFAGFGR